MVSLTSLDGASLQRQLQPLATRAARQPTKMGNLFRTPQHPKYYKALYHYANTCHQPQTTVFNFEYCLYLPSRVCLPASRTRQTVRVFVVYHTACSLRSLDLIDADARSNSAGMMINLLDRAVTTSRACLTSSDSHVAIHPVYIL